MEAGISEISSSKVLEQKKNTARSGMVLRSHSQGLQLSPLKRILVGASAKEGVRSRQGRPRRGEMASSTAVVKVHSGAGEIRSNGSNLLLRSFEEEGVAFVLTQMIQAGGARFEAIQAEMHDRFHVVQAELRDQRAVMQDRFDAIQAEMRDQRELVSPIV